MPENDSFGCGAVSIHSERDPRPPGLGIGRPGIKQGGCGVGMAGLRLHIRQGGAAIQRQGNMRAAADHAPTSAQSRCACHRR